MKKMDELREYYDNHDTAEDLAAALEAGTAVYETDSVEDPMITTSLRLPRSVLQTIRERAATEGIKPTALMRRVIEASVLPATGDAALDPVIELRHVIDSATRALKGLEGRRAA